MAAALVIAGDIPGELLDRLVWHKMPQVKKWIEPEQT